MAAGQLLLKEFAEAKDLSLEGSAPLRRVIQCMRANGKGVVVILRDGLAIGIVTERDVVGLLHAGADPDQDAEEFARKVLITTSGDRTIGYALNLMVENDIRRLVIVDESQRFLGVVTQKDLVRQFEEDFFRSSLRVKHICDRLTDIVSAHSNDSIRDILGKMVRNKISSVPIIEGKSAVGIITEKDILKLADDSVPLDEPVGSYMTRPVVMVELEAPLVEVVKTMNARGIRRVVVADTDGHATGIVTNRDLVRNLELDYNEFLERKLRYTKEVLNLLPEMMVEVIDTGTEHLIVWANEKVLARFGGQIIDKPVTDLVPADKWHGIYTSLVGEGKVEDVRFKREGSIYEFSGFYMSLDKASEQGRMQMILRDTTEEVLLATTDALTRIYNRRYMNEFLSKELERSRRNQRTFAVAIGDVDDFKKINDRHGHAAGDAVLRQIAEVMLQSIREYDIVGRYGGEEFLVIMPEVEAEAAVRAIERLRSAIEATGIPVAADESVSVTTSFGLAMYDRDGSSPDDLLVKADERLYLSKRQGKNQVNWS